MLSCSNWWAIASNSTLNWKVWQLFQVCFRSTSASHLFSSEPIIIDCFKTVELSMRTCPHCKSSRCSVVVSAATPAGTSRYFQGIFRSLPLPPWQNIQEVHVDRFLYTQLSEQGSCLGWKKKNLSIAVTFQSCVKAYLGLCSAVCNTIVKCERWVQYWGCPWICCVATFQVLNGKLWS